MENQKEEKENKKNLGQRVKSKIIIILLIFLGFWIGWDLGAYGYIKYLSYVKERQGEPWMNAYIKILKEQEEANRNDFVGGDTPEETIDLFVAALKKGDYELAVKYFEIQARPRWEESFKNPNKKNIDEWIDEIESAKNIWKKEQISDSNFVFKYNTGIGDNERTNFIYIRENINNKWKIEGF